MSWDLPFAVWYHVCGTCSCDDMVARLTDAGISSLELNSRARAGPGIVFFDDVTPHLLEILSEVSRNGVERVLAIAVTQAALHARAPWPLLRAGASDVFAWDHWTDPAAEIATRVKRWIEVDRLVTSPLVRANLLGQSATWIAALRHVVEVACFTDASILIAGESGTGKELVARLVHTLSRRANKRELVVLDCTTIVPELAGSEFFGHERGAFTGATGPRDGAFALADGGTLFLDEIGDLHPSLQAQLLRVVQEGTYKRVGGNRWNTTNFRLICATNRNLSDEVATGRFRSDLYYRIASVTCRLPPLRDRPEDIVPLFLHFLQNSGTDAEPQELDEFVRDYLLRRDYPGNVRDLEQLATRVACRHAGPGPVTVGDLPEDERPVGEEFSVNWCDASVDAALRRALAQRVPLREIARAVSESAIRLAVSDEEGNLQRAARRLGVTDRALQMRKARERHYPVSRTCQTD